MDFTYTNEQSLLRDSLERFLRERYDFETRRRIAASDTGWSREFWRALAQDLGLLAAVFPETCGGLGGGAVETLIIMEEFGKTLVIEPFLTSVVLAGGFLQRASSPLAAGVIEEIMAGKSIVAVAHAEPRSRYEEAHVETAAQAEGSGYRLNGHKAVVIGAPWADRLIVSARCSGAARDRAGILLFLLDKSAPGITTRDYATIDGQRASEVYLDNVVAPPGALLCEETQAYPLIEQVFDGAIAALCAEGVGVLRAMHAATVNYAKERTQFGKPIAQFQVIQHRLVDMYVAIEQAVSLTDLAARALDAVPAERAAAASAAKVQIGQACRTVGQGAVQIHGGMGQSDETPVTSYFKRALAIERQFGSVDHHLRRHQRCTAPT